MRAIWIPDWCDMGIGETLIDDVAFSLVGWTWQQGIVVWKAVLTFLLRDPHEGLKSPVRREAAPEE
jgi:hypothetical protein